MSLAGARVLLTGGTGFIGSRVAAALDAAGARVTLLARASSGGARLGPLWGALPRVTADLSDPASLAAAVLKAAPEYALHLAKDRNARGFEPQARATAALAVALARAPGFKRWVRTAHAGAARGADELLARTLAERHGLSVCTLELFLVYGPGQGRGEFPRDLVDAAAAGRPLAAPEGDKDLVFVEDVARAYLLAAERPEAAGAWIPVGGGRLVTGLEAARAAARAAGRLDADVPAPPAGRSGGHPAPLESARSLLGWEPRVSLDEGLAKLLQWCRDHPDL